MQSSTQPPFILCENLVKIYKVVDLEVVALEGLDLEVAAGEMIRCAWSPTTFRCGRALGWSERVSRGTHARPAQGDGWPYERGESNQPGHRHQKNSVLWR
jgi:hypothetical protein